MELSGGGWACRHGTETLDTHTDMQDAIEHITTVASGQRPATLFLHRRDGTVRTLDVLQLPPHQTPDPDSAATTGTDPLPNTL